MCANKFCICWQSEWSSSPPCVCTLTIDARERERGGNHWKTLTGIMIWFQRCLIFILAEILIEIGVQRLVVMILLWWMIHCVRISNFLLQAKSLNEMVCWFTWSFQWKWGLWCDLSFVYVFFSLFLATSYAFDCGCLLASSMNNKLWSDSLKATPRWETWFSVVFQFCLENV